METHARMARRWRASLAIALMLGGTVAHAAGIVLQNVNYAKSDRKVIVKGKLDGYAGATTVTLRNLSTGRVLATAPAKNAQFGFQATVPTGEQPPCEIEVIATNGSMESHKTAEVRHVQGDCGRYSVSLEGVVTDEAIPFATVTVTLDGVTYTTVADEFGNYTLPIASANLNQLLKIEAVGESESGTPIEFTNLVGSFSRVLDEQLSSGSAKGNVTNVTTASYVLVLQANDGVEPTTEQELQEAETSVDATELLRLAAVIKLIVDQGYDLPAGETNLISFISDPEAVAAFIETEASTNPDFEADLSGALADILADSNLVAGFTAGEIPGRYYSIPAAQPGYLSRQGSILEFNAADGTGIYLDFNTVAGQPIGASFDWTVQNDGRLSVVFDTPVSYVYFNTLTNSPFFDALLTPAERQRIVTANQGFAQIPVRQDIVSYTYTRVVDGAQVDTVVRETRSATSVDRFQLGDGTWFEPSLPPLEETGRSNDSLRASLDVQTRPFAATCPAPNGSVCVPGTWLGNFIYSPGRLSGAQLTEGPYGDVLTFNGDGSVTGTLSGLTASWTVNGDGQLLINYPSGWQQKVTVLDTLGLEYGTFNELAKDGQRSATYAINVKQSAPVVLDNAYLANTPGKFWNGEVNSWNPTQWNPDGTRAGFFGWQFFDNSNVAVNVLGVSLQDCDADGQVDDRYGDLLFTTWASNAGAVTIPRGNSFNPRLRSWYPAASTVVNGDRQFYVMEVEKFVNSGDLNFAPRINFLREIDAPWTCSN